MGDRLILGVDPGKTGAYACLTTDGQLLWIEDAPDPHTPHMVGSILDLEPGVTYAVVERAQAMKGQGITSTSQYLRGYGWIEMGLADRRIPYETVPPGTWKKALGLTGKPKAASLAMAQQLWPTWEEFTHAKDHGRAEAALIGLWWVRARGRAAA